MRDNCLLGMQERQCAEKRLDEESRNGEDYDIRYWVAYRDSVKGTLSALEQMGGGNNADA